MDGTGPRALGGWLAGHGHGDLSASLAALGAETPSDLMELTAEMIDKHLKPIPAAKLKRALKTLQGLTAMAGDAGAAAADASAGPAPAVPLPAVMLLAVMPPAPCCGEHEEVIATKFVDLRR